MSDLIHIISWERFCQKDNLNDLDKYAQFMMERYAGLLDIRNLNFKQMGPILQELPEDCLCVLIEKSSLLLKHRNDSDSISGVDVIFKLMCLIARNNKNFIEIREKGTVDIVVKYIDLTILQLTRELDTEWLNLFEYLLYFLEIIYDPTFSWRRRKKLYFSEAIVMEVLNENLETMTISNDIVLWLCRQLNRCCDLRNRLLHLLCVIISGSTVNAQLAITPEIVDTFILQSKVNAEAMASFCFLISSLSKISTTERKVDLSVVVAKLLTLLRDQSQLRIHELRCLFQLFDSSTELCEQFIMSDIFSVLQRCIADKEADRDLSRISFMILYKLTVGPCVVRSQFIMAQGYEKVLAMLSGTGAQPPQHLVDLVFSWAVCDEFDPCKIATDSYVICDGNVVNLLVKWATQLALLPEAKPPLSADKDSMSGPRPAAVDWRMIFVFLSCVCVKSRRSKNECCQSGISSVICDCIKITCKAMSDNGVDQVFNGYAEEYSARLLDLLKDLFTLLELFAAYSLNGNDLISIIGLFKDKYSKVQCRKLIRMLNNVVSEVQRNENANCWFEFFESNDCIIIAPVKDFIDSSKQYTDDIPIDKDFISSKLQESMSGKINAYSFSLHCWINLSSLSITETPNSEMERYCIFRLLTESSNGFEVFLNTDGQLIVATCHQGEFNYVQIKSKNSVKNSSCSIEENLLKPGKWQMLDFVFQNTRNFFGKATVTVYIDGQCVNVHDLKYPQINEKISVFHVGGCPKTVSQEMISALNVKGRRKAGFLSNSSVKRTWLGEEHTVWGQLRSAKCRIASVACVNDAMTEQSIVGLYAKGPMNSQAISSDEQLYPNIVINYHALAYDPIDRCCLNLHPYIQSSKNNKFHCGYLRGARLSSTKLEIAINEIGGVPVLLPIIEQLDSINLVNNGEYRFDQRLHRNSNFSIVSDEIFDGEIGDSTLAKIVILLRKVCLFPNNQKQMERTKCIDIIGCFLQKIDPKYLNMNVVIAFHALADQCHLNIRTNVYKSILLDWRIWSRCNIDTRHKHCAFISNLVEHDRYVFRKEYGVRFFLDVIRLFHTPAMSDGVDETEIVRDKIYDIIYLLIHKHAVFQDYQRILRFLHECANDSLIQETLHLFTRLYDSSCKCDQDSLLLYESKFMESLFVLLIRDLSINTKEAIIKFLHLIITSDRVNDKHKDHLLLMDISFASIFIYKEFYESPISSQSIQELLDILRKAAAKDLFGVVQFLSLLTLSPIEQRINAMLMLKSILDKSPEAIIAISQQPGWQDILIHLLVSRKRENADYSANNNETTKVDESLSKNQDFNANISGFRRSSTWAFDESINISGFSKNNFDEILEEDEDYSLTIDNLETSPEDAKSVETLFLHRKSLESNDICLGVDGHSSNLNMTMSNNRSICNIFSGSDEMANWANQTDISLSSICREIVDVSTPEDELVQLILESLHMVIWSVLDSARDDLVWMTVHQVMESLRSVNERYFMLKPMFCIKQTILIKLLKSTIDLYRSNDQSGHCNLVHVKELIRLIVDSSCIVFTENNCQYDIELLELTIMLLQDCLKVWDDDRQYPELAALGFQYLIGLSCSHDLDIVSAVSARLHQIITLLSGNITYDEIAFIVVHLYQVLEKVMDCETYYFIAPILKTVIEQHSAILQVSMYLSHISIETPEFYDYFKVYCKEKEWITFVETRLTSAREIYESSYLNGTTTGQSLWRAEANEQTSVDRKQRRAITTDHKQLFEANIINLTLSWIKEERRRKDYKAHELQKQNETILRHWSRLKEFLTSTKGCWKDEGNCSIVHWKQSKRENYLRMRLRFDINYQFDSHQNASMERDHPSMYVVEVGSDPLQRISFDKFTLSEVGDDQLGDDEWISIENIDHDHRQSDINNNCTAMSSTPNGNKNRVIECRCKLITLTEVVQGNFELTNTHLIFQRTNSAVDLLDLNSSNIKCSINQIREVHLRRYNLQRSAIEIFLTDQTNYFFNFESKTRDKVYSKIISQRLPNLIYSKARSPADLLKSSNLTQRWVNREISNFEYLMQLNTIAGRTYNDLSQYPVFPWIISDYTSPKLDLDKPSTFRDLSKPLGVLNPKHEEVLRDRYDNFEDPTGVISKFHYGTHYSVSAGVMYYLVRMEPFTSMHINLQSGKFDVADRQFRSIPITWSTIMDTPNDNRELIPEFFYQPQFLKNENNFDFGYLQQTKTPVDNVELPAWASSPEDFIYQHRQALECEHVSQNLHYWIDLIFGYKQKGIEAVKAFNVFYYATYEGVIDFDKITDATEREAMESTINNFGQTPCQLLKHPHPRRKTLDELKVQMMKVDKYLPVMSYTGHLKHTSKPISTSSDPIIFVRVPFAQTRSIINPDRALTMVTIHSSNIVVKHNWTPQIKGPGSSYSIEVDSIFDQMHARRRSYLGTLNSLIQGNNKLYAVTPDCKYVISGGNIENRLTIMPLFKKLEPSYVATPHHQSISCLSIDIDSVSPIQGAASTSPVGIQLFGMSGSLDSTCAIWDWSNLPTVKVAQVLYGHTGVVVSVSLSMYLDVAISGSSDGTVNVHSVTHGEFLHCIVPGGLISSVNLSVNVVLLNRLGHVYVQWQHGQLDTSPPHHLEQFLSLYSLHGNHITTNSVGCNKVTVVNVVPQSMGSLDMKVIVGNVKGQLSILDGYYLTEINILRFSESILDANLLSMNGQYLAVALSNGKLIISAVDLTSFEN